MERVIHGRASGFTGDWYGNTKRKCPTCKKEFCCRTNWAYQDGYAASRNYYCSWTCLRQAQQEKARRRRFPQDAQAGNTQNPKAEQDPQAEPIPAKKHGGGRPRTEFTPETEKEIYRRYKAGQRASVVARELGIGNHGIYNRYRRWKAEEGGGKNE